MERIQFKSDESTQIVRKTFNCEIKSTNEGKDEGTIEAIVNVFNIVDRTGERTMPGMADASIAKGFPLGVWHHDWANPIAETLDAKDLKPEDPLLPEALKHLGGLYIKGKFVKEIDDSWQAFLKLKHGFIKQFSIGYRVIKSLWNSDEEVRELHEIEWFEWSPVLIGANQATSLLGLKNLPQNDAIIKQFLEGIHESTLEDHSTTVLDAVDGLIGRFERHTGKRLESASALSASAIERIERHSARLADLRAKGTPSTTEDSDPSQKQLRAEIDREFLKTMRTQIGV